MATKHCLRCHAASHSGAAPQQPGSSANGHHIQALAHIEGVMAAFDADNDALLAKVEAAQAERATVTAGMLKASNLI